ncbi:MAG: hypothetical protein OJF60_000189 [Burkholderiaceae bacterium]|nr:MAG: hypothetical protein OJF60_000189 [Burkholderiaceae bacterium]
MPPCAHRPAQRRKSAGLRGVPRNPRLYAFRAPAADHHRVSPRPA